MRPEYLKRDVDLTALFPAAVTVGGFEGGEYFFAAQDGAALLIVDARTFLGLLDDDDAEDMADELVSVYRFGSEAERDAYVRGHFPARKNRGGRG